MELDKITLEIPNPDLNNESAAITDKSSEVALWYNNKKAIHFEFLIDPENNKPCLRMQFLEEPIHNFRIITKQVFFDGRSKVLDIEDIPLERLIRDDEQLYIRKNSMDNLEPGDEYRFVCDVELSKADKTLSSKYSNSTIEKMTELASDQKFLDFTMKFKDGKELKVLKFILASKSPVFLKMLVTNMLESRKNEVFIADVDYEVMKIIVNFMHNRGTKGLAYHIFDVLIVADKYEISDLKKYCEMEVAKGLTKNIIADILIFADRYNAALLKQRSIEFIQSLNKFAASKPARIIYGILLVIAVAFGCVRLLQASNDLHASKNAKLAIIPEFKANLIHFDPKDSKSIEGITSKIDKVYDIYNKGHRNLYNCDEDSQPPAEKSCNVDWREFGPCNQANSYGYQKGTPCVFLKFKKLRDWMPNYLNATNLPDKMPMDLKDYIVNNPYPNQKSVWISCEGENPADLENIGPITYYPSRGFSHYYFPYKGQDGYLEPIIALYFERPIVGIVISIECTLWTQGSDEHTNFKILVD